MRRILLASAIVVMALSITSFAAAAGGKLKCFADSPATCTLNSPTSATLHTGAGGDAGVYLTNGKSTGGATLASVDYTFTYFCANTTDIQSCTGGGAPRWSIPINVGGDPKDALFNYAFLDGNGCINGGETPSGGAITVSTTLTQCSVNFKGVDYANWDAFAAANPTYTIASALPFVISDTQFNNAAGTIGDIVISNVNSTKS